MHLRNESSQPCIVQSSAYIEELILHHQGWKDSNEFLRQAIKKIFKLGFLSIEPNKPKPLIDSYRRKTE